MIVNSSERFEMIYSLSIFQVKKNLGEEKSKRQQRILTLMYNKRKVFLHCNIRH